jgi:Transposase DDE domain
MNKNLIDHYAEIIIKRKEELITFSKYLAVDAYFSKKSYVDKILNNTGFDLISRLRDDAVMYYIFDGQPTGKPGRPQVYDGKVDVKNPAMNHFKIVHEDSEIRIFSAIVYVKSLQRKVKIALVQYLHEHNPKIKSTKIYFSTDVDLSAWYIVKYYKLRFQIEFIYRDNQFTGLEHCQARSEEKLNFHFNASLTTVSIAKSVHWLSIPKEQRESFSMADVKTIYHNQVLLERFFDVFAIDPDTHKNNPKVKELYYFDSIAA